MHKIKFLDIGLRFYTYVLRQEYPTSTYIKLKLQIFSKIRINLKLKFPPNNDVLIMSNSLMKYKLNFLIPSWYNRRVTIAENLHAGCTVPERKYESSLVTRSQRFVLFVIAHCCAAVKGFVEDIYSRCRKKENRFYNSTKRCDNVGSIACGVVSEASTFLLLRYE